MSDPRPRKRQADGPPDGEYHRRNIEELRRREAEENRRREIEEQLLRRVFARSRESTNARMSVTGSAQAHERVEGKLNSA